jgi:hypothetical protein
LSVRRLSDLHSRRLFPILGFLALAVGAAVLVLTDYRNFYQDEWNFVSSRTPWTFDAFFLSHNEHWVTIPVAIWKVLFLVFGLRTHIPYEAALLVVHGIAAVLLFALVRRRSGDLPAFAAATILLVLGTGGEDIVWAFQISFVGSVAFGLLALLLLEPRSASLMRLAAISASLIASLMCSAAGLAFVAAATVEIAIDGQARRRLLALIAPAIAFAAWFVEFGSGIAGTPGAPCSSGCERVGFSADIYRGPITVSYLMNGIHFVSVGIEGALAGIAGAAAAGSLFLVVLAALLLIEWYWADGFRAWQLGLLAGAATWYGFIFLGRGLAGPLLAAETHYVYVGVALLLPLLAHVFRNLPWRGLWRPALAAAFAAAVLSNALQLRDIAVSQVDAMKIENAELQTTLAFEGARDLALDQPLDPVIMPQLDARQLYAAVPELGSPVPRVSVDGLRQLPVSAVDGEMTNLFRHAVVVAGDPGGASACQALNFDVHGFADVLVPSAASIDLVSNGPAQIGVTLGWLSPPAPATTVPITLVANVPDRIRAPDAGKPITWQIGITTIGAPGLQVCTAVQAA